MAVSANSPSLNNPIRKDIPEIQQKEAALLKMDPTNISDLETGSKRLTEISSGNWQFQVWNGSQWVNVGKLKMDVDTVDGYDASITPKANTVAVRDSSGKLQDSITGNATTADSAVTLSETLVVSKGGTGATTSEQARANLGVPPTSHASANTTYGIATDAVYGHAMAGKNVPKEDADSGSAGSDNAHFSKQDHVHPKVLGNETTAGNVYVSDATDGNRGAAEHVAASEKAVAGLYEKVNNELPEAIAQGLSNIPSIKSSLEEIEASSDGYYWYNDSEGGNSIEGVLPLGHFFMWPYSTPPEYAIIVNGAEYSRELYSPLWAYLSNHPELVKLETEWQSIASQNNGYCPYFSTGDGSLTFRVPKFSPYQQIAISAANAGTYHQAGLPNIEGRLPCESGSFGLYTPNEGDGALYSDSTGGLWGFASAGSGSFASGINIDASRFSDKYGRSNTVQPESNEWVLCVVALGRITNTGSADVSAVMQAIGVVQSNPNLQGTAHLRESWSDNSGGWYRIYSDGWCEQGGTVPAGQIHVSFYKPFIDMNFYINAFSISKNNTGIKHSLLIQDQITTEMFNLYVVSYNSPASPNPDSNYYHKWEAKGFIRE